MGPLPFGAIKEPRGTSRVKLPEKGATGIYTSTVNLEGTVEGTESGEVKAGKKPVN
jgi:hypothetical protein